MAINPFLLKALAVALAASQILIRNDVRTSFDAISDQPQVLAVMEQGCHKMQATLMVVADLSEDEVKKLEKEMFDDADAATLSKEILPNLRVSDLKSAYEIFCRGKSSDTIRPILLEVLSYYNTTLRDLPDPSTLLGYKLPEYSVLTDANGAHFSDIYHSSRRSFVPLSEIPVNLKNALIAAEDKHFYEHHGVDENGLMRAALANFMKQGGKKDQGGSTLTQQLAKNLFFGSKTTYERKLREMVLANQIEKVLSKDRILELYWNYVYLGRSAWGPKEAAIAWFGKSLDQLTVTESAFIAGMPKGPRFYNPDRFPEHSLERTRYVVGEMAKNHLISPQQAKDAFAEITAGLKFVSYNSPGTWSGQFYVDELVYEVKKQFSFDPKLERSSIRTTLHPKIQKEAEAAVQEGLFLYQSNTSRGTYPGPLLNLEVKVKALNADKAQSNLAWLAAIMNTAPPLEDVQWPLAVIMDINKKTGIKVGLKDGRTLSLRGSAPKGQKSFKLYDVIYVKPDAKGETASLRYPPEVQAATLIIENRTGRVVSMVGGFSHSLSQLNRTVHMVRQPGSTVKPMTYLAALQAGLQTNTLVSNDNISYPVSKQKSWSPDASESAVGTAPVTMRYGLENSQNRVTARLLSLFSDKPEKALEKVLQNMREFGVHQDPPNHWSTIIGGMEVPMVNIATSFATIANGGRRPEIRLFDSIEKDGQVLFQAKDNLTQVKSADEESIFQLRTLMQGVVIRGTAKQLSKDLDDVAKKVDKRALLSDFVAGKTGTSQYSLDTWFVGFTNDLTIAVWVGYDNANAKTRQSLGKSATGASVAAPIWARVFRATLEEYPLTRLSPPTEAAAAKLYPIPMKVSDGKEASSSGAVDQVSVVMEFLKMDNAGRPLDTRTKFYSDPSPPAPVTYSAPSTQTTEDQ
jgi:penicillin-binding protein 1A